MRGLVEGKVAVITGAGSGVGRAACVLFAQHGAKVIAADVDLPAAEETVSQVKAAGGTALAVHCDVSKQAAVDAAVARAVAEFGRLDIMYNNAGITIRPGPGNTGRSLLDATDADIDRLQGVNVKGVLYGCQAAIRQFEQQGGGGAIVNTASVSGLMGYGSVVYGATKGAVAIATRTLALEVANKGIRVNSVCPGGMPTNFIGAGMAGNEMLRKSMAGNHPLGRPIEPEDCASAALFLVSDLASNITGVNLPVDGGLTAGILVGK